MIRLLALGLSVSGLALLASAFALPRGDESTAASTPDRGDTGASANAETAGKNWPLFRGDARSSGVARGSLPDKLEVQWQFTVEKGAFEGTPVIVDGTVYLGDLDGSVFAVSLATGDKVWEHKTDSGFLASPAVRDGRVYIGDFDGRFYCLNARDGALLWKYECEAEIDSSCNFFEDKVLFGSQDATLYCLDAKSGELAWKHAIDDQIRCMPTIVEGRCFVAGCDAKLHVINLKSGKEQGAVDIQSPTGVTPAAMGSRVFFGTEGGVFFCVDWKKADVVWTYESDSRGQAFRSSPAVTEKLVVVGGRDKRIHALDSTTGKVRWKFAAKSRIDASPVIVGRRVFAAAADGRIYALNLETGQETWQFQAGGGFVGSPAVADGRLVIASDEGVVYCLGNKLTP